MNISALALALQLVLLTTSFAQAETADDAEVAKADEYKAAQSAEKNGDGALMLAQAKLLVTRFPASALAHQTMAAAFCCMNLFAEAAASAQKATELSPQDPIAWRHLGHIRLKQNMPEDAEAAYKQAVKVAKNDATHWTDLAVFYVQRGNKDYALQCLNYASHLLSSTSPDGPKAESPEAGAWRSVGEAYLRLNRAADAISHLKKAIVLQPNDSRTWISLAHAHSAAGDKANGTAAAQQAVRLAPDSREARSVLDGFTEPSITSHRQTPPPLAQQNLTLEQLAQIMEIYSRLQQMNNTQDQDALDMIERLQSLKGSRTRTRQKQTPAEANAWWQEYQRQQQLNQMQNEINRLRQQQGR